MQIKFEYVKNKQIMLSTDNTENLKRSSSRSFKIIGKGQRS